MPLSSTIVQSLTQQNVSQRIQFQDNVSAVLIVLHSAPSYAQVLENGAAVYPTSGFKVTPLIEIAGQITSLNRYEQTIKTVRGIIDLEPAINSFGLSNLWGVDIVSGSTVYDVIAYGYNPPEITGLPSVATLHLPPMIAGSNYYFDFNLLPFDAFVVNGFLPISSAQPQVQLIIGEFATGNELVSILWKRTDPYIPEITLTKDFYLRIKPNLDIDGIYAGFKAVDAKGTFYPPTIPKPN